MAKEYLTRESFVSKVKQLNSPYWNSSFDARWGYMCNVIEKLKAINPTTAVELGTAGISLMSFSDTIDRDENYLSNTHNKAYLFDATVTPWEIPDKKYDVFVGLQVLEHIWNKKPHVFAEIKRISKSAIITLPYKWNCEDTNNCHHMIDREKIAEYTSNEKPESESIKMNKIEIYYRFDYE